MFGKIDMLQIPQSEIDQLLWRSLGRKMEDSVQILAEYRALKERRTRDDPAGRRRDCVGDRNRQPNGDAIPPRAARPAA